MAQHSVKAKALQSIRQVRYGYSGYLAKFDYGGRIITHGKQNDGIERVIEAINQMGEATQQKVCVCQAGPGDAEITGAPAKRNVRIQVLGNK
ncbi:hypothetical protein [Caballeronia grimmiae]|uniref:hypothetical protein n=1 Tax=Caballeronia grimmiae TaxID=1071679 RepID=UPI0038B8DCFA